VETAPAAASLERAKDVRVAQIFLFALDLRMADSSKIDPNNPLTPRHRDPGGAAALPPGSLPRPYFGPQSDENRDPPLDAPGPVDPSGPTVAVPTKP
jgi:hypothetical protein